MTQYRPGTAGVSPADKLTVDDGKVLKSICETVVTVPAGETRGRARPGVPGEGSTPGLPLREQFIRTGRMNGH